MADVALLGGARAVPTRVIQSGYQFRHPELEGALRGVLKVTGDR
jgi:NAD dependent epimerase/dehydratase family enzyme